MRVEAARLTGIVCALLLGAAGGASAQQAPPQVNENCTVSVLNRTVTANADGTWILPNVPANFGPVRARVTCVVNGQTISGESDPFTVPANGAVNIPQIRFGQTTPIPTALTIAAPSGPLTQAGATLQLAVTAHYPGASTSDVTAATAGTTYTVSNAAIATVSGDGVIQAVSSGTVIVQASHEGASGMTSIRIALAGGADSDGDGIPDADEVGLGLDPNNPVDAVEDADRDHLTNLREYQLGTNLRDPDTDGDGLRDGDEADVYQTQPLFTDTDGDLIPDGVEVQTGSSPVDPNSYNLAAAAATSTVHPPSFVLTTSMLFPDASQLLQWTVRLIDGKTTLALAADPRTTYSSSDLTVCNFGGQKGRIFAGSAGACTITLTNGTLSATVTGTVSPFTPAPLSFVDIPGFANSVDVSGNYAYVAAGSAGLQVVDVANRTQPLRVASLPLPGNANDVSVAGNYAYVAAGSAGLHIVDVSNPLAPVRTGSLDTPGDAWDVVVRGGRAYVADGSGGLLVADVASPAAPFPLGTLGLAGTAKGVDVDLSRGIAVVALGTSGMAVVSVAGGAAPALLATLGGGDVRDVAISDTFAFLADFARSFGAVDLTNPSAPVLRAVTPSATGGLLQDVAVNGALAAGADVFFVNGVPLIDVSVPENPSPRTILDFRDFRDDNGTGIAVDASYVYLTAEAGTITENGVNGTTRLYIGQYASIQDIFGVAPSVQITSPTPDTQVVEGSTVTVVADAVDDVAVASVSFLVNGEPAFVSTAAPYQFSFAVPVTATLTIDAIAVDYGGNTSTPASVTVTVLPDPLTTVIGRVTSDGGQPVEGASVSAIGKVSTTGAGGTFVITDVPTARGPIVVSASATIGGVEYQRSSAAHPAVPAGTTDVGEVVVVRDLLRDDFNRPDGTIGNGWTTWWCDQVGPANSNVVLENGELRTIGCPNRAGGIFRALPLSLPVRFSFDFRAQTPVGGGWQILFNAALGGLVPNNAPDVQMQLYQFEGAREVTREYNARGVQFRDAIPVQAGQRQYGPGSKAVISGVVNADFSAVVTVQYNDGLSPASLTFSLPAVLGERAPDTTFALGNSSAFTGPHFFDNLSVRAATRPIARTDFGAGADELHFDDLPSNTPVDNLYQDRGVVFENAIAVTSLFAVSSPRVIASANGTQPITIRFPAGVRLVGIQCDTDGFGADRLPQMRAFAADGTLIGAEYCSQGPAFLGIESIGPSIHSVQLGSAPATNPGAFVASDAFDNLVFDR